MKLILESPTPLSWNGRVTTNPSANTSTAPFFDPIDAARLLEDILPTSVVLMNLHI
jgi:hypothetical protein